RITARLRDETSRTGRVGPATLPHMNMSGALARMRACASNIRGRTREVRESHAMISGGEGMTPQRAPQHDDDVTVDVTSMPRGGGGGTDIAARLINVPLGEALGKPVIVENRAGAGGNIGIAAAARAGGDGYTLLVCSSAYVVNPSLYAQATYDPYKDFVPIMVIGASPNVFVVPAQSDIKTMPEPLARAKASPGKLNWTSPGAGTTPYLAGEVLKLRTGINILHIPFTGAGPATTAVLAGQVDLYTANIGSVGALIDAGKVRPIAVTSKERWPDLPTVPSLEELGIKDAVSDTFQGIYAPAGTPQPVINRLRNSPRSS